MSVPSSGLKERMVSVLAVGRRASVSSDGNSSYRPWQPAGSGICISPSVVVSCIHVIYRLLHKEQQISDSTVSPGDVAVRDLDCRWRTPAKVFVENGLDLAILCFESALLAPPATIAIDLTEECIRAVSRDVWQAVGFPGYADGETLTSAELVNGIGVAEFHHEDNSVLKFQFNGGVSPGFSGGALVWLGNELRPVVGMPRLGGDSTVTSGYAMDAILRKLRRRQLWPSRAYCMSDLISPRSASAPFDLDRRRLSLQSAFAPMCAAMAEEGIPLTPIPQGRVALSDGSLREVPHPVAIMCLPLTCASVEGHEDPTFNPSDRMATDLSRYDANSIAAEMPTPYGGHWRLPTRAEWWMAITAGRIPTPNHPGAPRGASVLSLYAMPENAWQIRPQPAGCLEWLAPEDDGAEGVISSRGQWRALDPAARLQTAGVRMVWDPVGAML